MKTDVLLVAVLSVVVLSPWLGRVTRLPVPTVQFACGCLLAIVPAAGLVNVSPELILLVVLPLILFWEGYQTSVAWAKRYWRPIVLNGVLLVIVTAGTVAARRRPGRGARRFGRRRGRHLRNRRQPRRPTDILSTDAAADPRVLADHHLRPLGWPVRPHRGAGASSGHRDQRRPRRHAAAQGIAIFVAVLTVRLAWISAWTVLLRTFDHRPQQREIRVPSRTRLVTVWGGLRGGISLAAALTIPASIDGTPFDHRADVLVLTFVVVALSLLVQGSILGRLVQWASPAFPPPPTSNAVADARQALAQRTLHALDDGNFLADADSDLRTEIHAHLETEASGANIDDARDLDRMRLQLAVLERKRHELIGLVAGRHVEDSVMWDLQHLLDREESRLEARLSTAELPSSGSMSGASQRVRAKSGSPPDATAGTGRT